MALAQQVANATDRGDARYYVGPGSGLTESGGVYSDGTYHYDSNGLSLDRPNSYVPGIGNASDSDSYNVWTGQASPSGGGGGGGGGGGDLTASPYYQQYQAQIQAAQAADLANTKSQLQQLLIQFGLVPQGFQDKYGALDDTIKQLIQKNTDTGVSQYARLLEQKSDAQRSALQSLAARGLSRSGSKGYALRRGTLDFNRTLSDALSSVLGNANQLQGGYASREMDRQSGLSQLLAQLASSYRPSFSTGGYGGYVPQPPQIPAQAPAPAPTFSAPGFTHMGVGVPNDQGYAVPTGGGYYTNAQTGDLTAKWQKLAGL